MSYYAVNCPQCGSSVSVNNPRPNDEPYLVKPVAIIFNEADVRIRVGCPDCRYPIDVGWYYKSKSSNAD
jgi:endogenous inhibitor of DNA gyrase (YacG/DUF329 family)